MTLPFYVFNINLQADLIHSEISLVKKLPLLFVIKQPIFLFVNGHCGSIAAQVFWCIHWLGISLLGSQNLTCGILELNCMQRSITTICEMMCHLFTNEISSVQVQGLHPVLYLNKPHTPTPYPLPPSPGVNKHTASDKL